MVSLEDYVTATEAAEIIGVSHSQVTRYASAGLLIHGWIGNQLVIKRQDAERFRRPPRGNPNYLAN